jgi:hypothetical protein
MDRLLVKLKRVESLLGELLRYFKKLDHDETKTKELTNFSIEHNKKFLRHYYSEEYENTESKKGFG